MGGDFNGDDTTIALQLLQNGYIKPGNRLDRNYRYKITKKDSALYKHDYRFFNVYQGMNNNHEKHLTVSLRGRKPGIMDHILFASKTPVASSSAFDLRQQQRQQLMGMSSSSSWRKRKGRRKKRVRDVSTRSNDITNYNNRIRIESQLATLSNNKTRTEVIEAGLPNEAENFPSDHLPVGALFVPNEEYFEQQQKLRQAANGDSNYDGSISIGLDARSTRQRHNALLRSIVSWLVEQNAEEIIQDKPLYQWKWIEGLPKGTLPNLMRAPDICFVQSRNNKLMMIEVTAVRKDRTNRVAKQKQLKYRDLALALSRAPNVQQASLQVVEPFVIVVPDNGDLPKETVDAIKRLVREMELSDDDGDDIGGQQERAKELEFDLLRVRNHWAK